MGQNVTFSNPSKGKSDILGGAVLMIGGMLLTALCAPLGFIVAGFGLFCYLAGKITHWYHN